jgi:hypothetical protein
VLAAANSILIPEVEFGSGVAEKPDCISDAVVDFEISTQGTLTGITVSPVGLDCNGQWIRLSLFSDGSVTASEQVVWQVPISSQSITSFTLRTNGTTTGTVGSIIWPSNEAGAAGRAATPIAAETINSFLLETSESALTDGP